MDSVLEMMRSVRTEGFSLQSKGDLSQQCNCRLLFVVAPRSAFCCKDKILSPSCRSHNKSLLLWSNKFTTVMLRLATLAAAPEMLPLILIFDYVLFFFELKAIVVTANQKVSFTNPYSAN